MADEFRDHCKSELTRLAHLDGFPREKKALTDYVMALMVAGSKDRAIAVIDEFVQAEPIDRRCPTAAQIRRVAYDKQERQESATKRCPACAGTGFQTQYYLATYAGGQLRGVQRIADYETSLAVNETLRTAYASPTPPTMAQQVISAARECGCHNVTRYIFHSAPNSAQS